MMQLKLILSEAPQLSANKVCEHRFTTWEDFKSGFSMTLPSFEEMNYSKFIYRGQRSSLWNLTASFDRTYQSTSLQGREELFGIYLDVFKQEGAKTGYIKESDSEISVIARAQHFGMPTRLLDWTYSPYIAAFFAFSDFALGDDMNDDVAIWVMNQEIVKKAVHSDLLDFVELYESQNERLIAQSGLFTRLYSEADSVNTFLANETTDMQSDPLLIKFTLPSTEAEYALFDLSLMGITSKSLFPGLEGVARYATIKSKISLANKQSKPDA